MQVQLSQLLHILYIDNNAVSEQTVLFLIFWVIILHVHVASSNTHTHTQLYNSIHSLY